ncbi:hypothetical protein K501DRAFT_212500 [Backusella circina FSU 941]|nr:hypothetical protein K501DRAFT_212500 [Backusella circina FSU 941]
MSGEYHNVEWDVHATTDVYTPRNEIYDPLSAFTDSENEFQQNYMHIPHTTFDTTSPIPSPPSPPPLTSEEEDEEEPEEQPEVIVDKQMEPIEMTITIADPQKQQDGPQSTFISFLVTTNTLVDTFSSKNPRPVRRRFQNFVWLHTALSLEYPACIIPPLPDKHRLEYIKGDRFSSEFIQRRQLSLQWFLDRISKHPVLQRSQCTRIFLESTDFKNDKRAQIRNVPASATVFESLSDTLLNAFAKIKKPDEKFEELKEMIDKLEDNLNTVERLYTRINKRQQDLQNDYTSFASSIQGLSALETNITNSLHQFAETAKAYSKAMREMTEREEMQFLNEIHELLAYCHAAKDVLKARDQKQLDFEGLSDYLHQTEQEKERTLYPNRKFNNNVHIADYVTDKINEVRGVNMEHARREKLNRLDKKLKELRDEVTKANDDSHAFSDQVVKEFTVFQKTKTFELKQGLLAYADCHIEFYQKGTAIWEKVLPVLESIDGVNGDGIIS